MNIRNLLAITAIGAAFTLTARADFFDNFDSYADTAAFNSTWTVSVGSGLVVESGTNSSAPNAVVNAGTAAAQSRIAMPAVAAHALDFKFDFYDQAAGNARDYGMLYSRAGGGAWTDGLNNVLAIGKYNNIAGTMYYGRVSTATGGIYGDGASTPVSTWFQLTTITPSLGWHSAEIIGEADPNHAGQVEYLFYVDGVLGGSVANLGGSFDYNWLVLGSGVSTAPAGIIFDNVSVATVVPEPSSIALCLLGGFGLATGFIMRRRRA